MQCPYCNEEIKDGAKKCRFCGEFLEKKEETPEESNFQEKVYKKDRTAKIVVLLCRGILAGFFFTFGSTQEGAEICIFLGLCCLYPILAIFCQRFILEKDRIKIVKGVLFKDIKYIQYNKINDAELNTFSSTIVLHTGNDKPTKFSWIQRPNEVLDFVQKKINK